MAKSPIKALPPKEGTQVGAVTHAHPEAGRESIAVAPGWFRAWPSGDEKWSAVNVRGASQVIVNHSREDDRHPDAWTVRVMFGDKAVELRVGPYDTKAQAIWVAHAVLNMSFGD
jgi:hypothetical protein